MIRWIRAFGVVLAVGALSCRPSASVRVEPAAGPEVAVFHTSSEQSPGAEPAADSGDFSFANDSGGKALARILPPAKPAEPAAERRAVPIARRTPAGVEKPDLPFVPPPVELPKLPAGRRDPVRPQALAEMHMLDSYRRDPRLPQRIELPPTVLLSQRAPDANVIPSLPVQARHTMDRASINDPTAAFSAERAIAEASPPRTAPATFLRFDLPQPLVLRGPSPEPAVEVMAPILRPLR